MSIGFAAIGLQNSKFSSNVATVLRAIGCYGAELLVIDGNVTIDQEDAVKTLQNSGNIHLFYMEKLAVPIAVDLVDDATNIYDFVHPRSGYYIFGPEDGTLSKDIVDWCQHKIYIPTSYCLNLAMTANCVLMHRNMQLYKK